MSLALRTVIVDSDAASRAALRRILAATPSAVVVNEFSELSAAAVEARSSRPDLLIVEVSSEEDAAVAAIHDMAKTFPEAAIFAIGTGESADLVIRVLRAGAVEFIRRPVDRADVIAALDKIARFRRGSETARRTARVTSVFCPKGGLGVTTMAVNLAVCVAGERQNTLLMDLDSRHSDSSTFLNLRPTYSVLDAFENLERLDESFCVVFSSGTAAACGPAGPVPDGRNSDRGRTGPGRPRDHQVALRPRDPRPPARLRSRHHRGSGGVGRHSVSHRPQRGRPEVGRRRPGCLPASGHQSPAGEGDRDAGGLQRGRDAQARP